MDYPCVHFEIQFEGVVLCVADKGVRNECTQEIQQLEGHVSAILIDSGIVARVLLRGRSNSVGHSRLPC